MLLIAALSLSFWNIYEDNRALSAIEEILPELQIIIENSDKTVDDIDNNPAVSIENYEYIGVLSIPDLSLELPVMDNWDYKRLKISPCRFYGSVYTDDIVIAAHNYSRHFGKISQLKIGSEIYFTDIYGETVCYGVLEIETLSGTDAEKMVSSDYDLTLFTCTYSGESRVTIRCDRK